MSKREIYLEVRDYLTILLGCLLYALAFNGFINPNHIAPGGVSGVAAIVHYISGFPTGTFILLMNIPLFLISWKELGREFGIKSVVATVALSLLIDIVKVQAFVNDPLLASVFGGVLSGVGLGLVLRSNGSTGGTDIIGKLLHKFFPGTSVGNHILIADAIVIAAAWLLIGHLAALYSLITVYVSMHTVDILQEGMSSAKCYYIISDKSEGIARRILQELDRGATFLKATGTFTHVDKNVLLCLITRPEISRLRRIIREEDDKAFVFVADAREVFGDGFTHRDRLIRDLPSNFRSKKQ